MVPYYFGQNNYLYGVFHSAVKPTNKTRSILMCQPVSQEYMQFHQSSVYLSEQLSKQGHNVFRFDYSGQGNSCGEFATASISQWVEDTKQAIKFFEHLTGHSVVDLFGIRLGAFVLLQVLNQLNSGSGKYVLLDPVFQGKKYLQKLESINEFLMLEQGRFPPGRQYSMLYDGGRELAGYDFNDTLYNEIDALEFSGFSTQLSADKVLCLIYSKDYTERDDSGNHHFITLDSSIPWSSGEKFESIHYSISLMNSLSDEICEYMR